jgi:uncharacterized protein GlcG (DUF336 family)
VQINWTCIHAGSTRTSHPGCGRPAYVVDDKGWPILLLRMNNAAYIASVELAPGKARTTALSKKPSQALEDAINHDRFAAVTARDFIETQGGLPIVSTARSSEGLARVSILRSTTARSRKRDSRHSPIKSSRHHRS